MGVTVTKNVYGLTGESEFEIVADQDDGGNIQKIRIHPWERKRRYDNSGTPDREVFLSIGWYDNNDEVIEEEDGSEIMENIIVDRDDFIEGILAVFPELRRA